VSGKRRKGRGIATCPYWATGMIRTRTRMLRLTWAVSTTCIVLLIVASLATRRGGDWSNNTLGSSDTTTTTTTSILTKPAQHYLFDEKVEGGGQRMRNGAMRAGTPDHRHRNDTSMNIVNKQLTIILEGKYIRKMILLDTHTRKGILSTALISSKLLSWRPQWK
jgi:hypothetical protein